MHVRTTHVNCFLSLGVRLLKSDRKLFDNGTYLASVTCVRDLESLRPLLGDGL
jgi:hypothetical protein